MTKPKRRKPYDKTCRAKTRKGTQCGRPAGWGTDHIGEGRCKLHGGKTPIKTGRYSKITRPRIKELIEQFENDPKPLDLLPEVKLLRALILDYIERYDEYTEALILWWDAEINPHEYGEAPEYNEDGSEKPHRYSRPRKIIDILQVGGFIKDIGSLIEKVNKQKDKQAVSMEHLHRVMQAMAMETVAAIREVIEDADTGSRLATAIQRRWESIRIDSTTNSS